MQAAVGGAHTVDGAVDAAAKAPEVQCAGAAAPPRPAPPNRYGKTAGDRERACVSAPPARGVLRTTLRASRRLRRPPADAVRLACCPRTRPAAIPPVGPDIPVSEKSMHVSHRWMDSAPDSYPIVKHSFLFSKANVELQAGFRPENKRLFQMPTRLVATTMQEQHPTQPVVSPLQPRTPLASHIRRNRRRPALRRNLNSVLAMSPGSPESPVRSGFLSVGFADTSPLGSRGPTPGSSKGFRKRGTAAGMSPVKRSPVSEGGGLSSAISTYSPETPVQDENSGDASPETPQTYVQRVPPPRAFKGLPTPGQPGQSPPQAVRSGVGQSAAGWGKSAAALSSHLQPHPH
eukprot:Tamp_19749.p1 GENE.Tamp_19749~~Tamp_19749.p1  ORF type:complete len:346 (+),score=28.28 Tamp_19749:202-1239(+)